MKLTADQHYQHIFSHIEYHRFLNSSNILAYQTQINSFWCCFFDNNIKYIMPERKIWTDDQDKVLKFLKEQRGQRKWANIARLMQCEFNIKGRTGKQCRERYHNHLDSSIINTEWTFQQQEILYQTHEEIGNKWSTISQKLPGRSDNCVKNHFYSKLRKSIRKLNKIIVDYFDNDYHQIKDKILSKIIQSLQTKFKDSSKVDQELADFCNSIKNRLFRLQGDEQIDEQGLEKARELIRDIQIFENNHKKGYKAIKKKEHEYLSKNYLKPPSSSIKRTNSLSSQRSQDSSSYLSSNSFISSCSDLSEFDNYDNYKSKTTVSRRGSSDRNSDIINQDKHSDIIKSQRLISIHQQHQEEIKKQSVQQNCMQNKMEIEELNHHQHFIEYINQNQFQNFFDNLIYEDTPVRARILAPSLLNLDEPHFQFFHHESDHQNDYIEFKQEQ